ncbi:MAG TPA: sigma-70 family RNA polymerase sigma factor [Clostridiaceae bacterium]|nr:sigma-70 family RNA polymerase sigma factor [Clostridiaceae bacterium]
MTPSEMTKEITRLVEEYGNDVLRIATVILKSKELAEDVFQETFLRVVRSYSGYRGESSEKTWIISIAVNICRDYMRSAWKKRVVVTDDFLTYSSDDVDTEEMLEKRSERQALINAIMKLPDKYREIIHLHYYQDMGINDIAKVLKIPGGTVKSRLFKARALLHDMIGGEAHG